MQVLVFGGTFDPPHRGHLLVAEKVLEQHLADEVWFLPVAQHPLIKVVDVAQTHHRIEMLKLLTDGHPRFKIETFEVTKGGVNFTIETLRALQVAHPDHTFSFITGSDNLSSFTKWREYQAILDEFGVLIYPRAGYAMVPLLPGMQPLSDVPTIEVSSTDIKAKIRAGEAISALVTPEVEKYIKQNNLYVTHS